MPTYRVLLAGFPGGGVTSMYTLPWMLETFASMRDDPRIGKGNVCFWQEAGTPVTELRNKALVVAEQRGVDFVLMYDNDMQMDLPYEGSVPFWDAAWEFIQQRELRGEPPCVIAAPYCGPPPLENCYVFRFENQQNDNPNPDFKLASYGRAEASRLRGIQRVAALPTGLMLIDMRAVARLPHPRFYYEYRSEHQTEKASTEDVAFSRDLTYAGVPLFCAWDSWAGHLKLKLVGRPQEIPVEAVPRWIVDRGAQIAEEGGIAPRMADAWREKPRGGYLLSPKPNGRPLPPPPAGGCLEGNGVASMDGGH